MDPGARTHPGRDALRILLIATLLSNISANYRRITVTPSAAERYNSSLPTQTVFSGCRFPVLGNENPDFARSSGSCGRLLGKICPAGFAAFLAQAAAESMSTRTHDWLLFPRGAAREPSLKSRLGSIRRCTERASDRSDGLLGSRRSKNCDVQAGM